MEKRRILLVDDEPDFVKVMTLRLQAHNYMVDVAYSGEEALEKVKRKPDLILLDIMLPKMSGYEVCHKLRQDKATSRIPIIMLTVKDAIQEKIEGLYIGADDYITKPFETEEVLVRIEVVLRRNQFFKEGVKDKKKAIDEIKRIIREELIVPHFQPIFYLQSRALLGVEALTRPAVDSEFANPEILFDAAFRVGMLFDLEKLAHKKALLVLGERAKKTTVFFNVSPYLIEDEKFRDFSPFYHLYTEPGMIALELTERTVIKDFDAFSCMLHLFKNDGFKISLDDLGSGYASLNAIVEIRPDFIKIDKHLIRNMHIDSVRQNVIKAIVAFCKQTNIISIAEGIETPEELAALIDSGVDAGQGYLLGRPVSDPQALLLKIKELLLNFPDNQVFIQQ
jgi:EAL domain-containing protein (putative c-di-GMP-specific phosphodiesterase class I)/CheY-like chemotaxis protein